MASRQHIQEGRGGSGGVVGVAGVAGVGVVGGVGGLRRCVVLRSGGRVEQTLLDAMAERGMRATVVRHEAEVMLELASAAADATLGLVVIDASGRPRLAELLEAVARYHPPTPIWNYEAPVPGQRRELEVLQSPAPPVQGGHAPLRAEPRHHEPLPAQPAQPESAHPPASPEPPDVEAPSRPLKIGSHRRRGSMEQLIAGRVDADPRSASLHRSSADRLQEHDGPLISQEELAMLLNPSRGKTPNPSPTSPTSPPSPTSATAHARD